MQELELTKDNLHRVGSIFNFRNAEKMKQIQQVHLAFARIKPYCFYDRCDSWLLDHFSYSLSHCLLLWQKNMLQWQLEKLSHRVFM